MVSRAALVAVVALLAALAPAGDASAADPFGRLTELMSTGPLDGGADSADIESFRFAASDDARRVYFSTPESLTPDDTDTEGDIYERFGGVTTLVSGQGSGGTEFNDPDPRGLTPDGTYVFFNTDESLVPADTDSEVDVYRRSQAAGIELVSGGPQAGGEDADPAIFEAFAAGGQAVFFNTGEPLTSDDTEAEGANSGDLYRTDFGPGPPVTTLVSNGTLAGGGDTQNVGYADATPDGSVVFFGTTEKLEAADGDTTDQDLYRRADGVTQVVSDPAAGGGGDSEGVSFWVGGGASPDGLSIEFASDEPLNGDDTDGARDVYRGSASGVVLVSNGPDEGGVDSTNADPVTPPVSDHHYFQTDERLVSAVDLDTTEDVYQRFGSTTTLISTGPLDGGGDSQAVGFTTRAADGGNRVFFNTIEKMTSEDTDLDIDFYERSGGQTTLVTTGPRAGGNDSDSAFIVATSTDGARVLFQTDEPLTDDDTDTEQDIYERANGQTALVTGTPLAGGGDSADTSFDEASPDAMSVFFSTTEKLLDSDPDTTEDWYAFRTPDPPPVPAPPAGPAAKDGTLPLVRRLRMSRRRFRLGTALPRFTRTPVGTRVSFTLSEAAGVEIRFQRSLPGRRSGRRCRKPTARLRGKPKCKRLVFARGSIARQAKAGANSFSFAGKLNRRRKLSPGSYKLRLIATDAAGNKSKPVTLSFTLLSARAR